jgi:hypothetical protein
VGVLKDFYFELDLGEQRVRISPDSDHFVLIRMSSSNAILT